MHASAGVAAPSVVLLAMPAPDTPGGSAPKLTLPHGDPAAVELTAAIHRGDLAALAQMLTERPELASVHMIGRNGLEGGWRTPLHAATDWPGYFPSAPAAVAMLLEAGANLETPGGSIGSPLDNAIGYGCWHVARLVVARGATVDKLWHAAALGMPERMEQLLRARPEAAAVSQAFWHACAGGQRRAAEYLLDRGADINWTPEYAEGTPLDAASSLSTRRDNVVSWPRERGATS